ncbi:MAG: branched-chain amino acid ABC transporter permease [Firmicutes bacterium]|nr:branched-chain amino acid ABC transporter permease [Bacillota bacterium]
MVEFVQQLINGISLGCIYALIALGYTMVYGIVRLINFAHGDIYMVGAYIGYLTAHRIGPHFFPALIIAMAGAATLGVTIEKIAYKPLRYAPRIAALTTAIGVSIFLENAVRKFISPNFLPFPEMIKRVPFEVRGVTFSNVQIIVPLVALLLVIVLQYIVLRTKPGRAMRAVSLDKDCARLMGVNVDKIVSITFAMGSSLAAAAGVLVGIAYPRIDPYMGVMAGLKAFVSAVLGGIGIIPGAALGGLFMGLAEVMAVHFINSAFKDAVAFVILIIVLLVKPSGLLGKYVSEKV